MIHEEDACIYEDEDSYIGTTDEEPINLNVEESVNFNEDNQDIFGSNYSSHEDQLGLSGINRHHSDEEKAVIYNADAGADIDLQEIH
jgi:hypothetical protein